MWLCTSLTVDVASASSRPPGLSPARCFFPSMAIFTFYDSTQQRSLAGFRVGLSAEITSETLQLMLRRDGLLLSTHRVHSLELFHGFICLHCVWMFECLHHVGQLRTSLWLGLSINFGVCFVDGDSFFFLPASNFSSVSPVLNPERHNLCNSFHLWIQLYVFNTECPHLLHKIIFHSNNNKKKQQK